jgi:hypothetical protein
MSTDKFPETKKDMMIALSKGETLSLTLREILVLLNKKLPDCWVSFKPVFIKGAKQGNVPYLRWTDVTMLLDYACDYHWTANYETTQVGDYVVITCKLAIVGNDGASRTAVGIGNEPLASGDNFGGPLCDSQAMSLRRAAATMGLGRYLYYPEITSPTTFSAGTATSAKSVKSEALTH